MFNNQLTTGLASLLLLLSVFTTCAQADVLNNLLTGNTPEAAAVTDKTIEIDRTANDDQKISRLLQGIFAELDSLKNVTVSANKGVITLAGQVDTANIETKAIQLASQVEGVVGVKNRLNVDRSLRKRLERTWEKISGLSKNIVAALPLFLMAAFVLALFWKLGGWLRCIKVYRRITPNHFIANLLGQIVHLVLIVVGIILALILLDATALIGTILGAAGIVGLAVGFAVKDTVENYISSILLSLRNPFAVNDYVTIDGHAGNVLKLTSRATILLSPDGNHIRIPNAMVFKAVITNYTRDPDRRFQFDVGIDPDEDLLVSQSLALEIMDETDGILKSPKPLVLIDSLGDSNVVLRIYAWVNQKQASLSKVRSEAIRKVKTAFDQAGIVMPEPIYKLRIDQSDGSVDYAQVDNMIGARELSGRDAPEPSIDQSDASLLESIQEVQDLSPDHTLELRVEEESAQYEGQNLLRDDAPKE